MPSNPSFLTLNRKLHASALFLCRTQEVKNWLEEVFKTKIKGESKEEGETLDVIEYIHNGTVLCELVNKMVPNAIPSFHKNKRAAFFSMENIQLFLNFCQEQAGMDEVELFDTADLFEGKNLPKVINTLLLLDQVAGTKWKFHPRLKKIDEEKFQFSEQEVKKAEFSLKTASSAKPKENERYEVSEETDKMMEEFIEKESVPIKIHKISSGCWMFGHIKVLIKSVNGHIMVRVGGGWMSLEEFLDKHNTTLDINEIQAQADKMTLGEGKVDQWKTIDAQTNHHVPKESPKKEASSPKRAPSKSSTPTRPLSATKKAIVEPRKSARPSSAVATPRPAPTVKTTSAPVKSSRPASASVKSSNPPIKSSSPALKSSSAAPKVAVKVAPNISSKVSKPAVKSSTPVSKLESKPEPSDDAGKREEETVPEKKDTASSRAPGPAIKVPSRPASAVARPKSSSVTPKPNLPVTTSNPKSSRPPVKSSLPGPAVKTKSSSTKAATVQPKILPKPKVMAIRSFPKPKDSNEPEEK
eukprot:TRINITY_DN6501_c0_g1_i1.p1 TRINITY_DN6501_c0_g1~~TRINITY_DN6501_c0_g1_i1.p1  ORF type:complete len:604 (+),score=145.86 TRINITY_DN6501_c0_g1_i1:235-1812(+)